MAQKKGLSKGIAGFAVVVIALLLVGGCQHLNMGSNFESTAQAQPANPDPSPLYYDFDDVLVPQELKMNKKQCFVYRSSGLSAGVLVLSGRVEINSLIAFFENNMTKDNWALVSVVRSPRTLMLFKKENRTCVITIKSGQLLTNVEIWVVPANEISPGAGLLKETGLTE